jgi:uncharacterized protein YdaU (DUF1376 family)
MHYYKFNVGNYYRHTHNLTLMEDLAYRRMLDKYYLNESPLPNDVKKIARLIGMRDNQEEISLVLEDFFTLSECELYWENETASKVIGKYQADAKTAAENGKKGGRPRKETQNKPSGLLKETQPKPNANPEESEPKANKEPLTINNKQITNNNSKLKDLSADKSTDVFNHWAKVMGKNNQSKFNAKRKGAVNSRFKEGYTVDQIKQAIDGCANTPHNMGQNDRGELYNDLELICRNGSNVERFAGNLSRVIPNQPDYSAVAERVTGMQQDNANQPLLIEAEY